MARSVHFDDAAKLPGPFTEGAPSFDPARFLDAADASCGLEAARAHLAADDFQQAIIRAFELPAEDDYVYHAVASVTLAQVQSAVRAGPANGLHAWYADAEDAAAAAAANPPAADIEAYTAIFAPGRGAAGAAAALAAFAANAKQGSLRQRIGAYLLSQRHVDASFAVSKHKNKKKKPPPGAPPPNPAFDVWAWAARNLQWAGPTPETARRLRAHHVLPVTMHHFGCVVPTEEALQMLAKAAERHGAAETAAAPSERQPIVEIGSGNGYWALMLRRRGLAVVAVDNQQSRYRTQWLADTVREDGCRWLRRRAGAPDHVLLLVYPITAGAWTADVLRAYRGATICIAGTQNDNRYTAFSAESVDAWMAREKPAFAKVVHIPLPSFPGKDEALYIWRRTPAP